MPTGFREAPRLKWGWALRYFFRPWQANPLRLMEYYELARLQGMLFPQREAPIVIDTARIPPDFIDGFRRRDCLRLDCRRCGYCERIAAGAVRVDPTFREQVLARSARLHKQLVSGEFWPV